MSDNPIIDAIFEAGLDPKNPFPDRIHMHPATIAAMFIEPRARDTLTRIGNEWTFANTPIVSNLTITEMKFQFVQDDNRVVYEGSVK